MGEHPKGRVNAKLAATLSATLLVVGVAVGCSPAQSAGDAKADAAEAAAQSAERGSMNPVDWGAIYPDQYNSYYQPGYNRSHANLNEDLYMGGEVGYYPLCVACKSSSDYNVLWDTYGDGMYKYYETAMGSGADAMDTLAEDEQHMVSELWDCESCHDPNNMEGAVGSKSYLFNNLGGDFAASLEPGEAVCAQCHNILASYVAVPDLDTSENTALDPYRYGIDVDGFLKAAKEDGSQKYVVDEELGVIKYKANHAIVENYQGSVHQSMGLTCTDCHMPEVENDSGEAYTDHDASGSIMDSNVKLETCLSCHGEDDGVTSVLDMFYHLRRQSTYLANAQGDAQGSLDDLLEAIRTATENGADEQSLADAKDAYTTAAFYIEYGSQTYMTRAYAPSDGRGMAAAHNFEGSRELFEQAETLCKETITSLV